MKFSADTTQLARAVSAVSHVSGRNVLPVLSGVLMTLTGDNLSLRCSNGDLTVDVDVSVTGGDDGSTVVAAGLLDKILRSFTESTVSFTVEESTAKIVSGRSEFELRTINPTEFPKYSEVDGDPVTVDADVFASVLTQVTPSASRDQSRPILTGVLIEPNDSGIRVVSTDSYRLAYRDIPGVSAVAGDRKVLVPVTTLTELVRHLGTGDVTVTCSDRAVKFEYGNVTFRSNLLEGDFPAYRRLLPDSSSLKVTFDREALIGAVDRVKVLAIDSTPVVLTFTDGLVTVKAETADQGQAVESIDVDYDGDEIAIGFNPSYLSDGLRAVTDDSVLFQANDSVKPVLLSGSGDSEFVYLLMPVRIR